MKKYKSIIEFLLLGLVAFVLQSSIWSINDKIEQVRLDLVQNVNDIKSDISKIEGATDEYKKRWNYKEIQKAISVESDLSDKFFSNLYKELERETKKDEVNMVEFSEIFERCSREMVITSTLTYAKNGISDNIQSLIYESQQTVYKILENDYATKLIPTYMNSKDQNRMKKMKSIIYEENTKYKLYIYEFIMTLAKQKGILLD